MMQRVFRGLVVAAFPLLAACAHNADQQRVAPPDDPAAFEDIRVNVADLEGDYYREGFFVAARSLAEIVPGTHRISVREALGDPIDDSTSRWWFYNINLPLGNGDDYLVCQYRITFDESDYVTASEWRRPQCGDLYSAMMGTSVEQITLSSDVLFAFDSAELAAGGQEKLDTVASVARDKIQLDKIEIMGHTDRLGEREYNLDLSLKRAQAVKKYLVSRGVTTGLITTEGRGANEPVVECQGGRVNESLKSCLQPNRRVQIFIHGKDQQY